MQSRQQVRVGRRVGLWRLVHGKCRTMIYVGSYGRFGVISAVPTGLGSSLGIHPALTCRANECRRFAAGIVRSTRYCLSCEIFLGNVFFRLFFFGKTLRAELQEQ